jgi:alkylation response protein AidB-like acyl-CoA dehydrogenase
LDFSWNEEQKQLRDAILKFGRQELKSDLLRLDLEGRFDREAWDKCGHFGIHGLPIPEQYGGGGTDPLTTVYGLENLGYVCRDNGLLFSINAHMWTCEVPILLFGTEEQKQKYLPRLCRGEFIGGNAITEPAAGSDAYSLTTTAEPKGDRYVLNGSKLYVTNGTVADLIVTYATVDRQKGKSGITGFLLEKGSPGLRCSSMSKMGLRTSPMAEISFQDCEIPSENRLGAEGAGVAIFTHSMEWERSSILASAVGAMERQLETCVRFARERKQFGKNIGKFQMVADKIVEMKLRLETARLLLYKTAWIRKMGCFALMEAAMTKLYTSESWVQSCQDAIQIHGGYGYMTEGEIERDLRDAIGSKLYSGTSEIQKAIIAQLMRL